MGSPFICGLRSVALNVPDLRLAQRFYTEVWRLELAAQTRDAIYLRGAGDDHHLLALHASVGAPTIRHVTLRAHSQAALHQLSEAVVGAGGTVLQPMAALDEPGRGMALRVRDPSGRIFQIVHDDLRRVQEPGDRDRPVRLAHVVLNCRDQAEAQRFVARAFGFVLSDRTRLMAFMNCNLDHHTLALSAAENDALNHIAFLMPTLDAVMRGAGRMRDHGHPIEWGPGRHGPGNNAFSYFIDPLGVVVEYTAEVAQIDQSYQPRGPADWAWPRGRSDQWGIGTGPSARLKQAQQQVFFAPSQASESL